MKISTQILKNFEKELRDDQSSLAKMQPTADESQECLNMANPDDKMGKNLVKIRDDALFAVKEYQNRIARVSDQIVKAQEKVNKDALAVTKLAEYT